MVYIHHEQLVNIDHPGLLKPDAPKPPVTNKLSEVTCPKCSELYYNNVCSVNSEGGVD